MKLYKTTYTLRDIGGETLTHSAWHGAADAASKFRTQLKAEDRNSKPSTVMVEVPTSKVELLIFLNSSSGAATSPF